MSQNGFGKHSYMNNSIEDLRKESDPPSYYFYRAA